MQNAHVASRAEFLVLFNGALDFAASQILCKYRKMDKTIHRNYACIQPSFSAYT